MRRAGAWRVSQVKEDFCVIAASYGPSIKEQVTAYFVRGVRVSPVHVAEVIDKQGRMYRWYVFPSGAVQLVNEGNVRERKVGRYDATAIGKAASGADGGNLSSVSTAPLLRELAAGSN